MLPYRGQTRRFAAVGLLALALPAAGLVAGCGSAPEAGPRPAGATRTVSSDPVVGTPPGTVSSAGAVCAARSPGQLLAGSRVVFTGAFLPGPAVRSGGRHLLLSPARMLVTKYLKGHGPRIVTVQTALTKQGSDIAENEDGILAKAGQEWKIFTASRHVPFLPDGCGASRLLVGDQAIP